MQWRDGILDYQKNPYHKQAKLVRITSEGEKSYKSLERKQVPWANSHSANMKTVDMEIALSVLQTMTQTFDESYTE